MAIIFSFTIHKENRYFVGTEIRGSDPPRKPRTIGTPRKLSHPEYLNFNILRLLPSEAFYGHYGL